MSVVIDGTSGITTPAETITTNLTFTGTGNRITGDMSNATLASRVMFQTSTANSNTVIEVIPNGTATSCNLNLEGDSAHANGTVFSIAAGAGGNTESRITSGIRGTGTYLPMTFYTGGSERARIDTSGNVGIGTASPAKTLHISGSAYSNLLRIQNTGGTQSGVELTNTGSGANPPTIGSKSDALFFETSNVERMRIPATGGIQSVNCVSVGNATPSTSGSGITFPATQSASSDANTLDDYEEGTFTPTLGASTNPTGVTYTNQIGFYRKIGSFVHVTGFISFTTYTGGSGNLVVNGIPFSPNVTVNWGTAMTEFIDYPVGKTFVTTIAGTGSSSMQLIFGGDNVSYDGGAIGTVAPSSGTVKYVTFGLSYFTS